MGCIKVFIVPFLELDYQLLLGVVNAGLDGCNLIFGCLQVLERCSVRLFELFQMSKHLEFFLVNDFVVFIFVNVVFNHLRLSGLSLFLLFVQLCLDLVDALFVEVTLLSQVFDLSFERLEFISVVSYTEFKFFGWFFHFEL